MWNFKKVQVFDLSIIAFTRLPKNSNPLEISLEIFHLDFHCS